MSCGCNYFRPVSVRLTARIVYNLASLVPLHWSRPAFQPKHIILMDPTEIVDQLFICLIHVVEGNLHELEIYKDDRRN
ncbi:hypothetical protein RGR602_PC00083 (plasmid) [Rhizobium gallicum bv. gallicum R602sp]|uniref:Uncharacterized protein n=1 Tax=Rhizobium gallicum bv. gallicum R602sp TaxID=1041138 RepID=A0A0B4XBI3_9HYPH|nr:hypothetical protein RGR602_PC00083 [Rhizobium gallicum bv. gallicum R602sp]